MVIAVLNHDGSSGYFIGGRVGGYSLLGALEVARAEVMEVVRDE